MEKTYHSLKDFELSYGKNAIERANDFQQYIEQLNDFGCKSYWITSHTGIGSTMAIEGFNEPVIAFISNDYLGMSQREETKQAGIDAIKKYGTGACAAQVIGGYLDIHQQLEKEIAFEPKAVVTELDPVVVYSNGQTGAVAGPSNITIYAKKDVKDTSCYTEKGALKIPMANEEQMFLRPAIIAGQFIAPGNFSSGEMPDSTIFLPRAPYTSTTYEIPKTLSVTIPVEVDEPSLIKVTTYLKKYSVKADYTITMTYRNGNEANDREVKFKGSWYGIINTTSKAKPDEIVTIPLEEYMKSLSNNNLQ